jgi:hypothetical protein
VDVHDIGAGVWMSTTRRRLERAYRRAMTVPPDPIPPWRRDRDATAERLGTLVAWRRGALLGLPLAPAAAAAGLLSLPASAVALGAALALVAVFWLAARDALRACVMHPELSAIPAVARERARLSDVTHRHRLARHLRRTAVYRPRSAQDRRLSPYPPERLAAARRGLLDLADAVEATAHPDPAVLVEIETLLRDGTRSPLLNADIPAEELRVALRRARFRLATDRPPEPDAVPRTVPRRARMHTRGVADAPVGRPRDP